MFRERRPTRPNPSQGLETLTHVHMEPAKWHVMKTINCGIKGFLGVLEIFLQLYSDTRKRPS